MFAKLFGVKAPLSSIQIRFRYELRKSFYELGGLLASL